MTQSQSEDSASSYNMQAQPCQLYVRVNAQLTQNKHFAIKKLVLVASWSFVEQFN